MLLARARKEVKAQQIPDNKTPEVNKAKNDALRNTIRRSTRTKTMLTSFGGQNSATSASKTLLGS
jgi:hypothetical protein